MLGRLRGNNNVGKDSAPETPKKKKTPPKSPKKKSDPETPKKKNPPKSKSPARSPSKKKTAKSPKKTDKSKKSSEEQIDKRKTNRPDPDSQEIKSMYPGGPEAFDNDNYDPSKWTCKEYFFEGKALSEHLGKLEEVKGKSIKEGIEHFQAHPELYIAMMYQTSLVDRAVEKHKYHLLHRRDTYLYKPQIGTGKRGWMTLLLNEYEKLPRFKNNELPEEHRDQYTDDFEFQGRKLHIPHTMNKPILPGRGMGIGDSPDLKLIGDIDPSDVHQGTIGDCWLLGAISAVSRITGCMYSLLDDAVPCIILLSLLCLPLPHSLLNSTAPSQSSFAKPKSSIDVHFPAPTCTPCPSMI
jgi:hypothetical protein